MSDLRQCPFCCGEADFSEVYSPKTEADYICIKCNVCGAQTRAIPVKVGDIPGREKATRALQSLWRKRRELEGMLEESEDYR